MFAAKRQLVLAQANLDAAKLNLSYTKIVSPVDGVVSGAEELIRVRLSRRA